jgi:hypothetical protein
MKTSIIVHPHAHLTPGYVNAAIAQTFSTSCSYNTCGNGIHVGTFAHEEAEMHALTLLKSWIPTHLSKLLIPGNKIQTFSNPPHSSTFTVKIPLHKSKLELFLKHRSFSILNFERLLACTPVTDSDIFISNLLEHCATCRTNWLSWLDTCREENAFVIPKTNLWDFLQVLKGLQLNILMQTRVHKNTPETSLLPLLEALQKQVLTYLS